MESFLPFFLILFVGVLFSAVFSRLHLPWVVALIVAGIFIGPFGFELVLITPTIDFLGQLGLIFLMFMAGLETKLSSFTEIGKQAVWVALVSGGIPMLAGIVLGLAFGLEVLPALLLGIIFVSSSIAVIVPSLTSSGLFYKKVGRIIVAATIIADVVSLVMLSVLLQTVQPITSLPLVLFYPLVVLVLVAMRYLLPRVEHLLAIGFRSSQELFQQELRAVFTVLVGTVIAFELLGLHPIIAGFFAGLVLSGSITSSTLIDRLRAVSYGVFIPTFFIVVGIKTDITIFFEAGSIAVFAVVLILGSILSKFVSGYLAGRVLKFSSRESSLIGVAIIPQLSTTLAVVFAAVELKLIGPEVSAAMVMLSVVTTFVGPVLFRLLVPHLKKDEDIEEVAVAAT